MNSNNKIFIAGSLANGACFSMILPLLAPFIRQLGLTELQGGALVSAGALVMAISAIYISKQTQKFSKIKKNNCQNYYIDTNQKKNVTVKMRERE